MKWKTLVLIIGAGFLLTRSRRKRTMLTKNFALEEFTRSRKANQLGITNTPGPVEASNLLALVVNVLQPLRDAMGYPITVTSGYRSPALNQAISISAKNSQHMKGQAADIIGKDKAQMFNFIKNNLPFDQLIWEAGNNNQPDWIHVSYNLGGNRKEVLRYIPGQGYSNY